MRVDGNWNLEAKTPIGELTGKAHLKSAGGKLTGTASGAGTSAEIADGTVNGDHFAGKVSITHPISLTINLTGKVSGNGMSGQAAVSGFGHFPFTGTRA
jgi:hypothetical protein